MPLRDHPQEGHPTTRRQDFRSKTTLHSRPVTAIRWKPSKSTSRSQRWQRSATGNSNKQAETHPKVLDDSGDRRPFIIKDRDFYPQPPTNTHSPTLNSEELIRPIISSRSKTFSSKQRKPRK